MIEINAFRCCTVEKVCTAVEEADCLQDRWIPRINTCGKWCTRIPVHYAVESGPISPEEHGKHRVAVGICATWTDFQKIS